MTKRTLHGNSEFRITVLLAEDQSGCKQPLTDYQIPTGEKCEKMFVEAIDECILATKDDETGGYYFTTLIMAAGNDVFIVRRISIFPGKGGLGG